MSPEEFNLEAMTPKPSTETGKASVVESSALLSEALKAVELEIIEARYAVLNGKVKKANKLLRQAQESVSVAYYGVKDGTLR